MHYAETSIQDAIEIIQTITCPDGNTKCHDGDTCCKSNYIYGGYDCCPAADFVCCSCISISCWPREMTCCAPIGGCPLPNAVCCKDMVHCCPHGTTCGKEGCIGSNFLPMLMGLPEVNNMEKVQSCT